uniref:ATP synthase subunit a n=1 Tax=Fundulus grandis TaxID=34779 RepID=B7U7T2_9TELE|nr:ATP synthase F0 subunit 6 [Fundulus grandis]ACJ67932.1 ATPase subunit 6 [Fundulus grandis]ACJ67945.1 ATPase subunit 6 [Fundulus grandis]WNH20092.1 ATP synthase F0 subunit 6 [Fundulus confluentus]
MTVTLFDQFLSPTLFKMPLIAIALVTPWLLHHVVTTRFSSERLLSVKKVSVSALTKHIFQPLGPLGHKWALMFVSLFMFLITLNVLGLLPYTFTPTTQLSLTFSLALPLWLATVLIGFRLDPTRALAHMLPQGTPPLLIPVLIIIETISVMIRPLALAVRLMANLTAGHLLIHLISTGVFLLTSMMPMTAILALALLGLLTLLEIAVAVIQAYVFVLLLSLYLLENV